LGRSHPFFGGRIDQGASTFLGCSLENVFVRALHQKRTERDRKKKTEKGKKKPGLPTPPQWGLCGLGLVIFHNSDDHFLSWSMSFFT